MIILENFSKKYASQQKYSVNSVSMKCGPGITGLIGLNGAGKTTILKAICSLHYATEGKVLIGTENQLFDACLESEKTKNLIGYVSENSNLPEKLTVGEFLIFVQKMYSPETDKAFFEKTVKDFELEQVLDKKIKELSKGFKQRVNFCQAFIHNPQNIILDEPINGLDPKQIISFRKILQKEAKTKTILISTHLMQEVHSLCNNIYVLREGKIIKEGTEQKILDDLNAKNLEEAFLQLNDTGVVNE